MPVGLDTVAGILSRHGSFQKQVELGTRLPQPPVAPPSPTGGPLTIESIEVTPIVVPLAQEYRGSYYRMRNRATVITRVVTREGIVGEAYAGDEDSTLPDIVAVVTNEIAPKLIGEDGFSIERCWELGFPVTYDQLRDRRIGLVALASVDLALWDAIGKALGRPLWQLWGGYRDRSRSTSSAATTAATWTGSATR